MDRRTFLTTTLAGISGGLTSPGSPAVGQRKPTNFQIACMTLPYSRFPLQRALEGIKAAGYRFVAWGTTHREDGKDVPVIARDAPPEKAKELGKRCRDMGLEPVLMFSGTYPENKDGLEVSASRLSAAQLGGLLGRITDNTISGKLAKEVFEVMWADGSDADAVIEARGLKQITDTGAIDKVIEEIIAANPKQLADYRSGKDKLFGFFVGQAMKATGGKANPALLNELLKKKLAP